MAIQILAKMAASPSRFGLPRQVKVVTRLSSTETSERCRFVYGLVEENDVVFADGTKQDERDDKVLGAATTIEHRLQFRLREGAAAPSSFQLIQDVFDEGDLRTRTRITLTIDGSPA